MARILYVIGADSDITDDTQTYNIDATMKSLADYFERKLSAAFADENVTVMYSARDVTHVAECPGNVAAAEVESAIDEIWESHLNDAAEWTVPAVSA